MKAIQFNRKAMFGVGAAAVAGSAAVLSLWPKIIGYFLGAVFLIGVVWIGSHYLVRALRRRRQQKFDAGVAAREGIDDRKREWASWTKELEQQGIDRYELPFYLLVGEPQSGKSVLLQNSDLSFPFGQTRLSGIGGTRGCDWWFTEEAVILDLAGRLFTHEGGASDEAEWEAFLGLLASYRPLCPANGLMLVIPCDSLLRDNRDEANRKANKIQSALLTLTKQLQAQLPIYVILTKADRIFGFAETVHRLDAEQRQQMFGWSRWAEDVAVPFDMVEVRRAFTGFVGRERTLRDTMMSTIRLPEGVPEVDRMYAFPDELEALGPNLEVYLKRIFSESSLVDRLYFRGFYLTSGLQTGTPIANVCVELFGATGEADRRDLGALFTKQHAYFIKDLVRRRVFSERGLVRPTESRVARSKRNAWLGYGAAAVIALVSVVASVAYVLGSYDEGDLQRFRIAIAKSAEVANATEPSPSVVLAAMDAVWAAKQVPERNLEKAAISRTQSFGELYCKLCDGALLPRLRSIAEKRVHELLQKDPPDHATFLARSEQVQLLLAGFDPGSEGQMKKLSELFVADVTGWEQAMERRRTIAAEIAIPASRHEGPRSEATSGDLADAARRIAEAWDRTLLGGDPLQVRGAAGYVVAWQRSESSFQALSAADPTRLQKSEHEALRLNVRDYNRAASYLLSPQSKELLTAGDARHWRLPRKAVEAALDDLAQRRNAFLVAHGGAANQVWPRRDELTRFMDGPGVFGKTATPVGGDPAAAASNLLEGPRIDVPGDDLVAHLQPTLIDACAGDRLGFADRDAIDIATVTAAAARIAGARDGAKAAAANDGGLALRVVEARALLVRDDLWLPAFPDWPALRRVLAGGDNPAPAPLRSALVTGIAHLAGLRTALTGLAPTSAPALYDDWIRAAATMLGAALHEADPLIAKWGEGASPRVDPALLRAFAAVREVPGDDAVLALELARRHVGVVQEGLLRSWDAPGTSAAETTARIVRELDGLGATLAEFKDDREITAAHHDWMQGYVAPLLDKRFELHAREVLAQRPLPTADVALLPMATDTLDWLKAPKQDPKGWLDGVPAEIDAATVKKAIADVAAREGGLASVEQLGRIGTRPVGIDGFFSRSPRVAALKAGLEELRALVGQPEDPQRGPRLAAVLRKHFVAPPTDPMVVVTDWYLDRLRDSIAARLTFEVRRRYESDLRNKLALTAPVLGKFLHDAEAAEGGLGQDRKALAAELAAWFGPKATYETLLGDYGIDPATPPGSDFRPLAATSDFTPFFECDEFLRQLRVFLQSGDSTRKLDDCNVKILLEPVEIEKGVWKAFNYVFTVFETGNDQHFFDFVQLDDKKRFGPLQWSFGAATGDDIAFRWTKSPATTPQDDDAGFTIASCLAPLVLVWFHGEPQGSAAGSTTWNVDWPLSRPAGMHARFRLVFDRVVPRFVRLP